MAVLAGSGEMLSAFGEVAAVERVLFLFDGEEFLHGGDVEVVEESASK
jgi:hypothetical protein